MLWWVLFLMGLTIGTSTSKSWWIVWECCFYCRGNRLRLRRGFFKRISQEKWPSLSFRKWPILCWFWRIRILGGSFWGRRSRLVRIRSWKSSGWSLSLGRSWSWPTGARISISEGPSSTSEVHFDLNRSTLGQHLYQHRIPRALKLVRAYLRRIRVQVLPVRPFFHPSAPLHHHLPKLQSLYPWGLQPDQEEAGGSDSGQHPLTWWDRKKGYQKRSWF